MLANFDLCFNNDLPEIIINNNLFKKIFCIICQVLGGGVIVIMDITLYIIVCFLNM